MTEDWRLVQTNYGQGNYGYECEVCKADDYDGPIVHKAGCEETAEQVLKVREAEAKTLAGAVNELSAALNETWRLITEEVERVAKKMNDIWENRGKRS
jgi:hypothetical protein